MTIKTSATMNKTGALILMLTVLFFSCRKEGFITSPDAVVSFSTDTLKYDTVFVTAGSTYRTLKIRNENNNKLNISAIRLMGGPASAYKMNVDGLPGASFSNIVIEPNDSLYVFVQVLVNPAAGNLPFIIRDSIEVEYNGKKRQVQLEAWGKNAHFLRDHIISSSETWINDLPYVILGSLLVDDNQTLTINKGCRIYVHADAPLIIRGTLSVNGLSDTASRVYFQGDRLDDPYRDYPAAWPGIFFMPGSKDNVLNNAVLKNAYQAIGLLDPSPNANVKIVLNECIIDQAFDAGIIALNSSIRANNCLISNCGKNLLLAKGGDYQFTHCTVASIGNGFIEHRNPVLFLSNYANGTSASLTALFRNCIFWGENGLLNDEVVVEKNGASFFQVNFDANLWKLQNNPSHSSISQAINNQHPMFDSINTAKNYYDFRLKPGSPALEKGVATGITLDLDGNPRPVTLPDLGCFEKQ